MQFSAISVGSNCLDSGGLLLPFFAYPIAICLFPMSSVSGLHSKLPNVRARIGASHFKSVLLGSGDVAGDHQARQVMDSLERHLGSECLDRRTWRSWFSSKPPRPRTDAVEMLDRCVFAMDGSMQLGKGSPNFYKEMMTGGLVRKLLEPTKSQTPESVLHQRAAAYTPHSQWHLHLDALDVAALAERDDTSGCNVLLRVAIAHLAEMLHQQWNMTDGNVYANFSSDFALSWAEQSAQEQIECQHLLSRFKPPVFDWFMRRAPRPMFDSDPNIPEFTSRHIHKTLLWLAADVSFLRADRLQAWSLALASSTLLLHAQIRIGHKMQISDYPSDPLYVASLERLLFHIGDDDEVTLDLLEEVQRREGFSWSPFSIDKPFEARSNYEHQLQRHGVHRRSIEAIVNGRD